MERLLLRFALFVLLHSWNLHVPRPRLPIAVEEQVSGNRFAQASALPQSDKYRNDTNGHGDGPTDRATDRAASQLNVERKTIDCLYTSFFRFRRTFDRSPVASRRTSHPKVRRLLLLASRSSSSHARPRARARATTRNPWLTE